MRARASRRTGRGAAQVLAALLAGFVANAAAPGGWRVHAPSRGSTATSSLWAALVAASRPIGPAKERSVAVLVDLRSGKRPVLLYRFARARRLGVRWEAGTRWASLSGAPAVVGAAFDVPVLDYRAPSGREYLASPDPARLPKVLGGEVAALGRIGGFRLAHPVVLAPPLPSLLPRLVPAGGLSPARLVQAYGAAPLRRAGYDGAGQTVVLLDWAPPRQSDLESFAAEAGLPPLRPLLAGEGPEMPFADDTGVPGAAVEEATMDAELVHEIAPAAKVVVFDANPSGSGDPAGIATLFQDIARSYPGAIWSLSIGWLCDRFYTWPDLEAINSALSAAEAGGTTAFSATGDADGLECEEEGLSQAYDTPPGPDDVGLDAASALPAMTAVGGTTLSVRLDGAWFAEEAWDDSALALGTGGGVSTVVPRPSWQRAVGVAAGLSSAQAGFRETPDVAADADPRTGAKIIVDGQVAQGGGTSQAAPIWAGLCALMDQFLERNGGHALGAINPILYELARTPEPYPPFHDVTLGGNAVHLAGVGYDLVTGLGTPSTYNLAWDLLRYERSHR